MRTIDRIVIHCADTPPTMDIGSDEIRQWHIKERGWKDIGYHYVIRRNGIVEKGRDLDHDGDVDEEVGAHVAGFNSHSIGICLVGGKPKANFTVEQWDSLKKLVKGLSFTYKQVEVVGHCDLDPHKTCPQFDVKSWWANNKG